MFIIQTQRKSISPKELTWIEVAPLPKNIAKTKSEDQDIARKKKRIVQTVLENKVKVAQPDAFLGLQNQTVDRQTVGKVQSLESGGAQTKSKSSSKPSLKALSKLGLSLVPLVSRSNQEKKPDEPRWATPGTRPEDYVKGMVSSDRTALNTQEYIFYGYFQRIRERLDRAWVPMLRARLTAYFRTGRHLASDMEHVTRLVVILNGSGQIIRVEISGESGTKDLDEAAIAAFNQAGPFPNPPKGMVDLNQEIKIPWDFVLKT